MSEQKNGHAATAATRAGARVAVVTGASSGIGEATARQLGARGWSVVLVARRADRLHALASDIEAAGGRALAMPMDAADPVAARRLRELVLVTFGVPDAIVNSAGAGVWRWMEDTPPEQFESMLDAPMRAAWHTTQVFLADLVARGQGTIVHVGSPASLAPWPGATGYTTSRWALRGMHEALRQDLAGTGVRSCHVLLGEVTSEYFLANPDSQQYIPRIARIIPVISSERAAQVVVDTIDRPRAQVFFPRVLALMQVANRIAPRLVALAARRTGRRRGV